MINLEPELEEHFQQYRRFDDERRALATVLLGDDRYVVTYGMPKYSGEVDMLSEPRVAVRYASLLGLPSSKSAHLQRAEYFLELKKKLRDAWSELVSRCVLAYGKHGPLISGAYRDHFPDDAKDRLRFLAHGETMASDAARVHQYLTKTRSPYFRW